MRSFGTTAVSLCLLVAPIGCGEEDAPTEPAASDEGASAAETAAPPATSVTTNTPPPQTSAQTSNAESGPAEGTTEPPAVDSGSGGDTMGEPEDGEPGVVRFAAFGDTGEGNESQLMVANAAEVVCEERGCDFALLLGDNFYDTGVTSVADPQFVDKFEQMYEGLDIPFYVILGNHDYGSLANDWIRGNNQVMYSALSDRWTMPHFWYTFTSESGGTQFFAFDTARMMWNHDVGDQRDWIEGELAKSTSPWKIAFAHHPYLSNGQHGNAGRYEGLPGLPFVSGVEVQEFIDDYICGTAQVYISGHDHNRQMFDPVCGTYFFVSGASAKTSDFEHRDDNPTMWEDDTREGFLWIEISGTELTAAFYDFDAVLDHEMTTTL